MKMILIWILMTLLTIQSKAQYYDTTYQSISYQKTLFQKGRFEFYGWTSYDLYWENDDINPNEVLYDLDNDQIIIPNDDEPSSTPSLEDKRVVQRNVNNTSRRRF